LAENLFIEKEISEEEKYIKLILILKNLLDRNDHVLSGLANVTAAIKQTFDKVSWAGFYLRNNEDLYLGPFQGKIACTRIAFGKGVCGTAAEKKETIIVPDVSKFPGHIVCDEDTKSEIVVPVFRNACIFGVLDLDSLEYDAFGETDKHYLEEISSLLTKEILEG
jgi:L-methionine (R)-S-oxide reductase